MEVINKLLESLEKELLGKECTLEEVDRVVIKELKWHNLDQGSDFRDIGYYGFLIEKALILEPDMFDFGYEVYYDSGEHDPSCGCINKYNLRFIFKLKNPTLVVGQHNQLSKDTSVKVTSIEVI